MLEYIIYLSPLAVLFGGIFLFSFYNYKQDEKNRCFKISRILLSVSLLLTVIFYNKPMLPDVTAANRFTLLFQVLLYGGALMLLYLSRRWFVAMKLSGYRFCYGVLLAVLAGDLLIVSRHLTLTLGAMVLLLFCHYMLLKNADQQKQWSFDMRVYVTSALICTLLLLAAAAVLYWQCGTLDYKQLYVYLSVAVQNVYVYAAAAVLIFGFMFLLCLAPLHYCFTEMMGKAILPVFAYFILVPTAAYWGGFIRLHLRVLASQSGSLQLIYMGIGLLSIGVGAVGACSGKNIRKILAYSSVYHLGIVFLLLQHFTPQAAQSAFIYWLTYMLAMLGICTALFSLKIKGEYLFWQNDLAGLAYRHSYVAAMLTLFLFSLLGLPPLAGFLGIFTVLNSLIGQLHFYQVIYVLLMMLVIGYAYIQLIKTMYFEDAKETFDRADMGLYTIMLAVVLIMALLLVEPHLLWNKFDFMIEAVMQ